MNSSSWSAATTVPVLLFLLISSIQFVNSEDFKGSPNNSADVRWQLLTKANYSSAIRSHHHLLLLVTVPWCGESRSLMKELASAVSSHQDQLGALKLMFLYRNIERVLAHTLGASEGIGVIYFHHSQSYKYGGRLRVQNILSSVEHAMCLLSKGDPLKPLNTREELRNFLDSTDKALLLLEFCGWTSRLLAKGKSNMTRRVFGPSEEANATHLREKRKQKVDGNGI